MINEGFYPTPKPVIEQMLAPYVETIDVPADKERSFRQYGFSRVVLRAGHDILEPSAGKGDLADYLVEKFDRRAGQIDCIEIEPDLRATLTGKGYRVVDSDFLSFDEPYHYDLVIMNPPFADGVSHLLKAWQVVADGGRVICLLNAESLNNPYTNERQLLQHLISEHGRFECIGQAFKDAERPTDVEVAIVWLEKPEREKVTFEGVKFEQEAGPNEAEFGANPLASRDTITSLVHQYQAARQLLQDRHDVESKIKFYTRGTRFNLEGRENRNLTTLVEELKQHFWRYVFDKTKVGHLTTSNFQKDFEAHVSQTSNLAFSESNIYQVLTELFGDRENIMQRCIVEAFDRATSYHEKNKIHVEGWKTNKCWKLSKRVIHPWGISTEWSSWRLQYGGGKDFYDDLDKALCFIQGISYESVTSISAAIESMCHQINQKQVDYDSQFESTHFRIRMYKKGTVHLEFKDLALLAQFNLAAAKGKNWVGPGDYDTPFGSAEPTAPAPAPVQLQLMEAN